MTNSGEVSLPDSPQAGAGIPADIDLTSTERSVPQSSPSPTEELDQLRQRLADQEAQIADKSAELEETRRLLREANKNIAILGGTVVRMAQEQESERAVSRSVQKVLERIANTDMLTGLANRAAFDDQLSTYAHSTYRRRGSDTNPGAVAIIDIDKFKEVNDTAGHSAGDDLLVDVAERLRDALRPSDTVARYGGDEFAVIIRDATRDECITITERLLGISAEIEAIGDGDSAIRPTLSIGVKLIDSGDSDGLLEHADAALYRAKNSGRNRVEFAD